MDGREICLIQEKQRCSEPQIYIECRLKQGTFFVRKPPQSFAREEYLLTATEEKNLHSSV